MIKVLATSSHTCWRREHPAARCKYGDHPATRLLSVDGRKTYACMCHQAALEAADPPPVFIPTPPIPAMTAPPRARMSMFSQPPKPKVTPMTTTPLPKLAPNHIAKIEALENNGPCTYPELQVLWKASSLESVRATGGRLMRLGVIGWNDDKTQISVTDVGRRALSEAPPTTAPTKRSSARRAPPSRRAGPAASNGTNGHYDVVMTATKKPIVVRLDDMVVELPTVADVVELRRALTEARK